MIRSGSGSIRTVKLYKTTSASASNAEAFEPKDGLLKSKGNAVVDVSKKKSKR